MTDDRDETERSRRESPSDDAKTQSFHEPWSAKYTDDLGPGQETVMEIDCGDGSVIRVLDGRIAQRIVACVNACAGIEDPEGWVDATMRDQRGEQFAENITLSEEQRRIAELEAEVSRLTDATKRAIAERDDYWNLAEKRRFENETLKDHVAALRGPLSFYVEADKAKRTLMDDRGRPEDKNFDEACKVLRETKA